MAALVLVAGFGAVVEALAVEMAMAQPTHASASTPALRSPQITTPPSVHELIRRQEAQTFLVGPDNTCGYVDGISSTDLCPGHPSGFELTRCRTRRCVFLYGQLRPMCLYDLFHHWRPGVLQCVHVRLCHGLCRLQADPNVQRL